MLRRTAARRFATIADGVRFDRTAAEHNPGMLTAPEQAYAAFAREHGLCPVGDLYRGVAQGVYAFATMLGRADTMIAPSVTVQRLLREHPTGAAWSWGDNAARERLLRTDVEDAFCETSPPAALEELQRRGLAGGAEYPFKSFDATAARSFDLHERLVRSKSTDDAAAATRLLRCCVAPSMRQSLYDVLRANNSGSGGGGVFSTLCRTFHCTAYDDEVLEALNMSSFEIVPRAGTPASSSADDKDAAASDSAAANGKKEAVSNVYGDENVSGAEQELRARLDDLLQTHDVQVTVNALFRVPQKRYVHNWAFFRKRMKFFKSAPPAATPASNASGTAAINTTTNTSTNSSSSSTAAASSAADELDGEESKASTTKDAKDAAGSKKDDAAKESAEAYREAVKAYYGGSETAASAACDNTSRILAVSGAINVFRAIDWVVRNVFGHKDGAKLDPRAFPLHVMGLSEQFPVEPARYVKTYTFVYNGSLQHWRLAGASTVGHYLRDHDAAAFAALGGFVPKSGQ